MSSPVFPALQTSRLSLRKLQTSDWEAIIRLRTDKEINRYINRPVAENKNKALEFISQITTSVDAGDSFYWTITSKSNERMIGSICLWNFSDNRKNAEIGFELIPELQRSGLMDESIKAVVPFGFANLDLTAIEAYVHQDNLPCKKLLTKNGFVLINDRIDASNYDHQIFIKRHLTH